MTVHGGCVKSKINPLKHYTDDCGWRWRLDNLSMNKSPVSNMTKFKLRIRLNKTMTKHTPNKSSTG